MNYTQINQTIIQFIDTNAANVIATIPTIINFVEQEIASAISNIGLTVTVDSFAANGGGFVANNPIVPKPAGWRRNKQMYNYAGGLINDMQLIDISVLNVYLKNSATGVPIYYADADELNWAVAPIPDQIYDFTSRYVGLPELLSVENQNNWFSDFVPWALVYGSLLKCQPYLKNPEMVPIWTAIYDKTIASITSENDKRMVDSANDRRPG